MIPPKPYRWVAIIPLAFIALIAFLLLALPFLLGIIEWSYNVSSRDFDQAAKDTLPYIFVSVLDIGVWILSIGATAAVAIATVTLSLRKASQERRQQDTQKILLETRLSSYFQEQGTLRRTHFPVGQDASENLEKFKANPNSPESLSVVYLLNFYEFLSIGILRGNLDEKTLKDSLRWILCTLAYDMRSVIAHIRKQNDHGKFCENLERLSNLWRGGDIGES